MYLAKSRRLSLKSIVSADEEEAATKEVSGLPPGYMLEHDGPSILMDMCPDLLCDDVLKQPTGQLSASRSAEDLAGSSDEGTLPIDLETGLQNRIESDDDAERLGPRDSARTRYGVPKLKLPKSSP